MIHFDDRSFTEGIDINIDQFLQLLQSEKCLPKTSAPPPDLFSQLFTKYSSSTDSFICIHPSAELSGTIRSAETAKLDFPDLDIRIIDSRLVASPLGVAVHQASIWASEDQPVDVICDEVIKLCQRNQIYFLVGTLDYLARGGRIGGASALIGNALQIKPILTVIDGRFEQFSKERTFKRALNHIKELIISDYPKNTNGFLSIMHADNLSLASDLGCFFEDSLDVPSPIIGHLPPAIITHVGPNSIAVSYFRDSAQEPN
jgi:DegV family protein with EDD domain